jgi:2-hydroxychromene-2-carboxylate isomerase
MVMRNLKVPVAKAWAILWDSVRIGDQTSVDQPLHMVCDPVGIATERAMAVWPVALRSGHGREFLFAWANCVYNHGVSAATDRGMQRICCEAQVPWAAARAALEADQSSSKGAINVRSHLSSEWRKVVEKNRQDMILRGVWGVPCFTFGTHTFWGQDRLWALENVIIEDLQQ